MVRLRRSGGRVVQECDLYIGRALNMGGWRLPESKFKNPFKLTGKGGQAEREDVLKRFEAYLRSQPELMAAIPELRGKRLGCWCAPQLCHGDVLCKVYKEMVKD